MISLVIYLVVGVLLIGTGGLIQYLFKNQKKDLNIRKGLARYFRDSIPLIFYVAGIIVILCGIII